MQITNGSYVLIIHSLYAEEFDDLFFGFWIGIDSEIVQMYREEITTILVLV